ncbi:MAG: WYL domain-containing transcriptional regulator [Clostridia bacterium]|nr:WYL domain-containing transcriptional regulator [Clostridia bacterium]
MPKSSNQKLKLLYIMKYLLEETDEDNPVSTAQIIDMLASVGIKAERKSVYENIEDLRQFGIDVENSGSGRSSGYYIASRDFEMPELKLLVDAVQSSKFITRTKSDKLIKKIEGLTGRFQAQQLQRQVFVSNRIKHDNESIYYNVDEIHTAINTDTKLSFFYFDWTSEKTKKLHRDGKRYIISPWALSWDDENYYMIGYDSDADMIKHYRVDKMEKILAEQEKREGREKFSRFDMAVYSKKVFGMFGGEEKTVTIRFADEFAGAVIDRFGRDAMIIPGKDGHFTVRVNAFVSPLFYSWVFGFGKGAKIISPSEVADEFAQMVRDVCMEYEKK